MSIQPPTNSAVDEDSLGKVLRNSLLAVGIVAVPVLLLFALMDPDSRAYLELMFNAIAGPILYPQRVFPQIRPKLDDLLTALVCLVLLTFAAHRFFGWLYRNWGGMSRPERTWKLRWTLYFVGGLVLLFSAGIAAIGVVHQVGWIARSETPMYQIKSGVEVMEEERLKEQQAKPTESRP